MESNKTRTLNYAPSTMGTLTPAGNPAPPARLGNQSQIARGGEYRDNAVPLPSSHMVLELRRCLSESSPPHFYRSHEQDVRQCYDGSNIAASRNAVRPVSLVRFIDSVPHAPDRMNERRIAGSIDLVPQPAYIRRNDAGFEIEFEVPNVPQEHRLRDDLALVPHQCL